MLSLFLNLLITFTRSVEESEYRQCEQSKFCERNREVEKSHWKIIHQSIIYNPDFFQASIQDELYDKELILHIWNLDHSLRFRIEPAESESFKRYDVSKDKTVISGRSLNRTKKISHGNNGTHIFLRQSDTLISIRLSPFSITISNNRGRIASLNPYDTAVFEFNRDRSRYPRLFDSIDFNGNIDKPLHGPTAVAFDVLFLGDAIRLSGLPEHTLNLTLPMTTHRLHRHGESFHEPITDPIRLFNVDVHRYEVGSPMAMYGSIPFILSRDSSASKSSGIFWCNPTETWVDISEERNGVLSRFISEGGYIDLFVFLGPTPADVINQYTNLTGRPSLPQSFTFGYHQSRWGYLTSDEIRYVDRQLDLVQIPHDALWLDIDHTDDKMYFTWHPHNFADAIAMQDEIDPLERKFVAICDPHILADPTNSLFESASNSHYLIKTRSDTEYIAECWPGDSAWVDFLNPWARNWWEGLHEFRKYQGSTLSLYIWNDMNEPSVFGTPDHTCPRDLIHYHGHENREIHNVYGLLMTSSTWGGLFHRDDDHDDRPFILTRSFFAGSQKYACVWTGDNAATWEQLRISLPMVLSLGIAGMPFSGADVGGFFDSPNSELLCRWYQLAAYAYPFFREHCHHKSEKREPYLLKGAFFQGVNRAIENRYRLFPYFYSLARRANLTGEPIVRPLWWTFPNDRRFADCEDKVMIGNSILVIPVLNPDQRDVKSDVPFCRWYDFETLVEKDLKEGYGTFEAPITKIPVMIKGGSIIPIKEWKRRTTYLMYRDPFTLYVCLDEKEEAAGELYVDDGMTFEFAKGNYMFKKFSYANGVLSIRSATSGIPMARSEYFEDYKVKIERVKISGLEKRPALVKTDKGESLQIEWEDRVLTIHRVNMSVRDDWYITLEFEGELPPDVAKIGYGMDDEPKMNQNNDNDFSSYKKMETKENNQKRFEQDDQDYL